MYGREKDVHDPFQQVNEPKQLDIIKPADHNYRRNINKAKIVNSVVKSFL